MRLIVALTTTLIICSSGFPALAETAMEKSAVESVQARINELVAAESHYDVGFLWLDRVAVATFKLQKSLQPGFYIASLSAKTVGFAATLTSQRKQQYVSMMKLMPDGSFRSVRHTSQVEKGGVIRTKVYLYDFDQRTVVTRYSKNNKLVSEKVRAIEGEAFPSDVLTTYFNLVSGFYGPMEVGRHYEIVSMGKKGVGNIYIDFLAPEKRPKKSFFSEDLLICQVKLDQEVFDSKNGILYLGYDENLRLSRGVVTDVIGMGDVRGVLK